MPSAESPPVDGLLLPPEPAIGEGVQLTVRPASLGFRLMAALIDLVLVVVLLLLMIVAAIAVSIFSEETMTDITTRLAMIGVLVGFPVVVETATRGRSLGKLIFGLRVVRDDLGPVRFRQSLARGLLMVVDLYASTGLLAVTSMLGHPSTKRLGDLLAGTIVIRDRAPDLPRNTPAMPDELQTWARQIDLSAMPDALAVTASVFLRRAASLNPGSRAELGRQLAQQFSQHVAPQPPAGTHPETYLAAVLATRYQRDLNRLRSLEQRRATRRSARARTL